jgi:hypothetical protein
LCQPTAVWGSSQDTVKDRRCSKAQLASLDRYMTPSYAHCLCCFPLSLHDISLLLLYSFSPTCRLERVLRCRLFVPLADRSVFRAFVIQFYLPSPWLPALSHFLCSHHRLCLPIYAHFKSPDYPHAYLVGAVRRGRGLADCLPRVHSCLVKLRPFSNTSVLCYIYKQQRAPHMQTATQHSHAGTTSAKQTTPLLTQCFVTHQQPQYPQCLV